jgi:hypothetical protein
MFGFARQLIDHVSDGCGETFGLIGAWREVSALVLSLVDPFLG